MQKLFENWRRYLKELRVIPDNKPDPAEVFVDAAILKADGRYVARDDRACIIWEMHINQERNEGRPHPGQCSRGLFQPLYDPTCESRMCDKNISRRQERKKCLYSKGKRWYIQWKEEQEKHKSGIFPSNKRMTENEAIKELANLLADWNWEMIEKQLSGFSIKDCW
jgi:hypothetical protein